MLLQTISSDLLMDLAPEKQQLLSGGCKPKYGGEEPTREEPVQETSPIASQPSARLIVGNIITVTPFAKCLTGQSCFGGEGSQSQY